MNIRYQPPQKEGNPLEKYTTNLHHRDLTFIRYCCILIIVMTQTITITPKWQIYIPLKIREVLHLTTPGKAEITVENKKIVIKPTKSLVLQMAGKYKNIAQQKKINLETIREKIRYDQL
ncbi:MAG TPA: AbrB/MazE/SpoVT family DNA-binding domain-containing protein [Patescibacteria group bacterium]|nr:AbrB/MazE/SpoVT family DNA-binding domain-containing protein [Patescibacteria group bacterium]